MSSLAEIYKNQIVFDRQGIFPKYKRGDKFLYYVLLSLPLINAAADSTIYYFVEADQVVGLHPGIIRGIILILFILLFGYKRIQKESPNSIILVFLAYLFILTMFSSNAMQSFLSGYIKWFIPLMMFPVGLYFFKNHNQLLTLNLLYIWGALIVCINLGVAQITGYGISAYVEKSFYTGGAGVGITNQLALVLLTYPFLIRQRSGLSTKTKWLVYIVGFFSIVFVFVAMKRAGIISLLAGTIIYLYFTQSKVRFFRYFIVIGLVFYLAYPVFQSIITERYDARMKQMQDIENEARYQEFFFVIKEFKDGNISQKLFGSEVFNTGQFFGQKYFHTNRMIHSDMSSFFYGSGLIGISLYLSVFFLLYSEGVHYRKILRRSPVDRELFAIYFSILFATFIISASGSGTIGERCLVFLYLGAIIGVSKVKMKEIFTNTA